MHRNILIAAGGTGGHIIPAIELGNVLNKSNLHYVCGNRKIETDIYSKRDIVPMVLPFSNYRTLKNIAGMILSLPLMIMFIIRKHIDLVILMGSYMSFTTGIAALITQRPVVLMEQDIVAGRNIKIMSIAAKKVFTGFNVPYRGINASKRIYSGHLIGKHADARQSRQCALFDNDRPVILVCGGSQGALNMYRKIYPILKASSFNAVFIGSSVMDAFDETENIRIVDFTNDMGLLYRNADIIISRAGALSMAEIVHAGKRALFIPLPTSSEHHQDKNIKYYMSRIDWIDILNENKITKHLLLDKIRNLMKRDIYTAEIAADAGKIIRENLYYV